MTVSATAALLAEVFPGSAAGRSEYLEWLYEQSPFGGVIETNLDDQLGRAGHYALVPMTLSRDGTNLDAALSLNTAVHERARGGGAFVRLASETIEQARRRGVRAVIGVANANSTPGFIRRLDFELVQPLPANVLVPTPGPTGDIRSAWASPDAFSPGGLVAGTEALLDAPAAGEARRWTIETLRWRLARPGSKYAVHRSDGILAVSCCDERHGIRVAVLLKVFADKAMSAANRRAIVRAVCWFHRAPVALHVGLNHRAYFSGVPLPKRMRESPLNLIFRRLEDVTRPASIVNFEFLDFDAY
jgi:hypothetical protein